MTPTYVHNPIEEGIPDDDDLHDIIARNLLARNVAARLSFAVRDDGTQVVSYSPLLGITAAQRLVLATIKHFVAEYEAAQLEGRSVNSCYNPQRQQPLRVVGARSAVLVARLPRQTR